MSGDGLTLVEQGMRLAQERAAFLSADAANAHAPGFVARDLVPVPVQTESGMRFAASVRAASDEGPAGTLEFAMGATAENSVRFRALAEQERAMLREFRTVAEEARR